MTHLLKCASTCVHLFYLTVCLSCIYLNVCVPSCLCIFNIRIMYFVNICVFTCGCNNQCISVCSKAQQCECVIYFCLYLFFPNFPFFRINDSLVININIMVLFYSIFSSFSSSLPIFPSLHAHDLKQALVFKCIQYVVYVVVYVCVCACVSY